MAITAFRTIFFSLCLTALLAGCSHKGDFGRTEPSFFENKVLAKSKFVIGSINGNPPSALVMSEDEQQLRSLAHQLADPAERSSFRKSISRQVHASGLGKDKYEIERHRRHRAGQEPRHYKSPYRNRQALYYAIEYDINLTRRFTHIVRRVYQTDKIRNRRLSAARNVAPDDSHDIKVRIKDNRKIVYSTLLVLKNRIADNRLDLRNMKLKNPGPLERDIARKIAQLAGQRQMLARKSAYWRATRTVSRGQPQKLSSQRDW